MQRGEICGCPGCLTQTCCDGFQCSEVGGQGGKLYCINAVEAAVEGGLVLARSNATESAQCLAEGQTCGGPGLPDSPCCGEMRCERHLMGTHNKQCVAPPAPKCMQRDEICGCPDCLTQTC